MQIGAAYFAIKFALACNEWRLYNNTIDDFRAAKLPMSLLAPASHLNKVPLSKQAPSLAARAAVSGVLAWQATRAQR